MDALEFLKEKRRMCDSHDVNDCTKCPVNKVCIELGTDCEEIEEKSPEKLVEIIEQWSKEHPRKTNEDKFVEVFGGTLGDKLNNDLLFWEKEYKEPERSESK